jgi:hypothetical protein
VTPEANGVIGLFFALWAHGIQHSYDRSGRQVYLWLALIPAMVSVYFLIRAFAMAVGWIR